MKLILILVLLKNVFSNEFLSDSSNHLFHFVHVTDIHISQFQSVERIKQFEQFCEEILKRLIKPQVTVVTGDLTHNRDSYFGSAQYEIEWKTYREILNRTEVTKSTNWLDIRGNHDSFMDPEPDSKKSFYRIYSEQGRKHESSYRFELKTRENDVYSFIGIDFTPRPGPGRPFNFLGQLSQKEIKKIEEYLKKSETSTSIIAFGHYPLSFTHVKEIYRLLSKTLVYLNGHLHLLFGQLYFRHSDGLLELELGDWKDNRRFRLMAIDSGLISFGDFQFDQPIYAVLTNPKSSEMTTNREPLERIRQSSHIRILIYSREKISRVRVSIDSIDLGEARLSIDSENLFVLSWNPKEYQDENFHRIQIEISDEKNQRFFIDQEFTLSTKFERKFRELFSSGIVLIIDWPKTGFVVISTSLIFYMISLVFFRYRAKRMTSHSIKCFSLWNKVRQRMLILCSIDSMYYSLIGLSIYHFIGPWYIGYLTEKRFGFVFLWGTIIGSEFLSGDMQIYIGAIQFFFFIVPLTGCLSSSSFYRYNQLQSSLNLTETRWDFFVRILSVNILFIYSILFFVQWSFGATASYKYAWIFSPFGIPLSIFSLVLYLKTKKLKFDDFHLENSVPKILEKDSNIEKTLIEKDN